MEAVAEHRDAEVASLRFLYIQVLKRGWRVAETPYPKKVPRLPQILSQEEVARLIDAAEPPFHRVLLMTLYVTGAPGRRRCRRKRKAPSGAPILRGGPEFRAVRDPEHVPKHLVREPGDPAVTPGG